MESDADMVLRYLKSAQQLLDVAAGIKDAKSRQIIVEAAEHYEQLAAELTTIPQRKNSN
jgi:hypothetical protein